MKDEIQAAIRMMKSGKAGGPGSMSVKLSETLGHYGIEKIAQQSLGQRSDCTRHLQTFMALSNTSGAAECELHRRISLIANTEYF